MSPKCDAKALTADMALAGENVGLANSPISPMVFPGATLWLTRCDASTSPEWEVQQLDLLHESERQRYYRFLRPQRRRQFLVGRFLLRHALSEMFSVSPASWQIRECPGQAPRIASDTPSPVTFSLAHSGDRVACMLASGAMVGVDIEYMGRQRDFLGLAAHCFHPENVSQLQALQAGDQFAGFYRLWTLHEAALKAYDGCDGVRSKDPYGCGWDLEPVFATAVVGQHSIALAMCGDVLPPDSIKQLHPGARVEILEDVDWKLHRVERLIPGSSSPAYFAPYSQSGIEISLGPRQSSVDRCLQCARARVTPHLFRRPAS